MDKIVIPITCDLRQTPTDQHLDSEPTTGVISSKKNQTRNYINQIKSNSKIFLSTQHYGNLTKKA